MPSTKKTKEEPKVKKYYEAVGRRKTSTATVRLAKGKGHIVVNNKKVEEYFGNGEEAAKVILKPLELTGKLEEFDISVKVRGGGKHAQIEAIRLGVARVLNSMFPDLHTTLKKEGLLTRDSREKERKKPGLKGARRAPQWSKR